MALIGARYADFGPTLATEKLGGQHAIRLSVETVRQQMIAAGYWKPKRGATISVHPMRERRARFGEMIQIDGSPHDWFEGRGEYCTLLVFIDDATGQLTQLRFAPTETTLGYMRVLHDHILAHGVPVALYSDKHSIFRINAKEADPEAETQFSRAARELGIELVKEMRLARGWGCGGAKVTVHEHFDGSHELLWRKRRLAYGVMDKPVRQSEVADGKSVNTRVNEAMTRRNTGHKSAHDGQRASP